jgi:hypothetical protein
VLSPDGASFVMVSPDAMICKKWVLGDMFVSE